MEKVMICAIEDKDKKYSEFETNNSCETCVVEYIQFLLGLGYQEEDIKESFNAYFDNMEI